MADVFSKAKRSQVMSQIRARGNKATELALLRLFRENKISGWRRHRLLSFPKDRRSVNRGKHGCVRVRPDFVFSKQKLAIFVDGCFWHSCALHATRPKSNAAFWKKKLAANKSRDRLVTRILKRNGWKVLRLWEHELTHQRSTRTLSRIQNAMARD